ncbi:protein ACCELERATED CELL DEATH 6 isoform X2 [Oryza sativa Japonica Group]|nr:protein ACCELERATED CELL DEATH 6 isoform X2 [Oryza sativa Japonica Group]EEE69515.1 hypothetical protein OsJ_28974 [Oryza sativa Japonica Group]
MTKMLLNWNNGLTEQSDENGSTPLHFAASLLRRGIYNTVIPVLRANPVQLYKQDSEGLYPIHVAASSGANLTVKSFIRERPEIAGLRDSKGRTFLHVAVERERWNVVVYACHTQSLARILNMQDNDGNTALHIAVKHGNKAIFCSLLMNKEVNLNISNNKGQTALDISQSKILAGYFYGWNPNKLILRALTFCNARGGCRRVDHLQEQYIIHQKQVDEVRESDKMTNSTQTLGIASVLIVTVTFGVMFAIPGGYKADDHNNGGTPTLAGSYIFDAFIMANTIAFICSSLAIINLMYSGMPMVSLPLRRRHFNISLLLAFSSVTSLGTAFALGMYLVLAPVTRCTAIAICAMMMIASLCLYTEPLNGVRFAIALYVRRGNRVLLVIAQILLIRTLITYWPCVIIFGWAAISTKDGHTRHG